MNENVSLESFKVTDEIVKPQKSSQLHYTILRNGNPMQN